MTMSNGMPPFDESTKSFLEWFESQPGAFFSPHIRLVDLSSHGRGRGIIATADIPADTTLFVIPRECVLNVDNSEVGQKLPQIFEAGQKLGDDGDHSSSELDLDDLPDPWLDLIVVLVYEYLHRATSKWKAYLDVLPQELDTLMYWDALELRELQSSAITDKIGKDEAEQLFHEKLIPIIKEHAEVFYPPDSDHWSDEDLVRLGHRMGSIIMAYAFDLEREEGEDEDEDGWVQDLDGLMSLGLVPMADLLNADAEFNAHLNHEETSLNVSSLRAIKAGEEILNYYGPLPNSELLRRYGYTSPKHSLYDVVELPWSLIRQAIHEELGKSAPLPPDEEMDESFVLARESDGPDETGVNNSSATFTEFPEELEEQIAPILAPALEIDIDGGELSKVDQARLGHTFIQVMARALKSRLNQYGTTIAVDQELLRAGKMGSRYRKAIDVRLGEKCLLQEAIDFAANALHAESPDGDDQEGDERAAKKPRIYQ